MTSRAGRFLHHNSLSLFFLAIFLLALVGQAFAGWHEFNEQQLAAGFGQLSFASYLASADFAVDVTENWQSEYLQFLLYIMATIWFLQQGSPESKELHKAGRESPEEQKLGPHAEPESPAWARVGGWRTVVFSNSLAAVILAIFLASWLIQSIAGWAAYNETLLEQMRDPVTWGSYLSGADFWSRTLQNWQSEFLAVGSMAAFTIYLRQRGSPESKPVGAPHRETASSG